jgi:hypothetical protein
VIDAAWGMNSSAEQRKLNDGRALLASREKRHPRRVTKVVRPKREQRARESRQVQGKMPKSTVTTHRHSMEKDPSSHSSGTGPASWLKLLVIYTCGRVVGRCESSQRGCCVQNNITRSSCLTLQLVVGLRIELSCKPLQHLGTPKSRVHE